MNTVRGVLSMVLAVGLAGCFGVEEVEFPDGLEPLEENGLPALEGEPFPEELVVDGSRGDDFETVFARSYFRAPIEDVWATFRDPQILGDRRQSPNFEVEYVDDPAYTETFVVMHRRGSVIGPVEWDVTVRTGVAAGTEASPAVVAFRFQKTRGTTAISVQQGSILFTRVTRDVTEMDFVYHIRAAASGIPQYRRYIEDLHREALAHLGGEPLPEY